MWNINRVLKLATLLISIVVFSSARSTPSKDVYIEHQGSWATRDTIPVGHMKSERQAADSVYWLDQMDHTGPAQGFAPFAPVENPQTYPVYRNVLSKSFGATGDGSTDDSDAIQRALDFDGQDGSRSNLEDRSLSTRPAQIFLPSGTYRISKTIHIPLNTIIVGDPKDRPVIKAVGDITRSVINATSHPGHGELEFFLAIKNIVIDTRALDKDREVTALHWATAQACQLTNLAIFMPPESNVHVGINMEGGSSTTFSDVEIFNGRIGLRNSNQQVNVKNVNFTGCDTAIEFEGGQTAIIQGALFDRCDKCIDLSGGSGLGSLVVLDCTATNSGDFLIFNDSSQQDGDRNNQIVIDNLRHSGSSHIAITSNGEVELSRISPGSIWIWGNVIPGEYRTGQSVSSARPNELLDSNGKFFTRPQPMYSDFTPADILNVKEVHGHPVKGDGRTDDSASLNAILEYAAKHHKLVYVPYGIYILRSTLVVPPGTRMVGECWPAFSGIGSEFGDSSNPAPVVMLGRPGEVGTTEIQDIRFTVADIAPGAIILQVNTRGLNKGDVALWNSHVTVGGFKDSNVNRACSGNDVADCLAAFAMVHLTNTSSVYIENMWGWTADHSHDDETAQSISTGRGILVEATAGTWLAGTSFEHNTLYNYNLHQASHVFAGLQQTETAYWQGEGAIRQAPSPWTVDYRFGDPDFSWCGDGEAKCRMGLAQNIDGGSDLWLYASAFWTFFHGVGPLPFTPCEAADIYISYQSRVSGSPQRLFWFGINSRCADVMILDDSSSPRQYNNPGGWSPGGVIAAYLQNSM